MFLSVKFIKKKIEKIKQYVNDIVSKLIIFVGCCAMIAIIYTIKGVKALKSVDEKIISLKKRCDVLYYKVY